jgi:hypothetical protein
MRAATPRYDTEIQFHTPPRNQGQMVTVSYGAAYPYVICREHDASGPQTKYSISRMLSDDQGDYWNNAPRNKRWRLMTARETENFRLV